MFLGKIWVTCISVYLRSQAFQWCIQLGFIFIINRNMLVWKSGMPFCGENFARVSGQLWYLFTMPIFLIIQIWIMCIDFMLVSLHISLCYSHVLKKWSEEFYNLNHIFWLWRKIITKDPIHDSTYIRADIGTRCTIYLNLLIALYTLDFKKLIFLLVIVFLPYELVFFYFEFLQKQTVFMIEKFSYDLRELISR